MKWLFLMILPFSFQVSAIEVCSWSRGGAVCDNKNDKHWSFGVCTCRCIGKCHKPEDKPKKPDVPETNLQSLDVCTIDAKCAPPIDKDHSPRFQPKISECSESKCMPPDFELRRSIPEIKKPTNHLR